MKDEVIILDDDDFDPDDDLAPEYDIDALRKAAKEAGFDTRARFMRIGSDVLAVFPDENAINTALRELIAARKHQSSTQAQSVSQTL
ncbi:MAG: hypothetical protein SF097_12885 [Acidobacteriota bacterium]|nr:hypothetical protein [Acidobacteriota bacterium]